MNRGQIVVAAAILVCWLNTEGVAQGANPGGVVEKKKSAVSRKKSINADTSTQRTKQQGRRTPTAKRSQASTSDESAESVFWRMIENSNEIEEVQEYIARVDRGEFRGTFKALAELRLMRLRKAKGAELWAILRDIAKVLLRYDEVEPFSDGVARVKLNGSYGFVDKAGTEIVPLGKYNEVAAFSEGMALVRIGTVANGRFGFVDRAGNEVIPPKIYTYAASFSNGLALVRFGSGELGFIDKTGRVVISLKRYAYAGSFSNGLALVKIDPASTNGYGFIDRTGREVVPPRFDQNSKVLSERLILVCRQVEVTGGVTMRCGVIDNAGKEIVPIGKYSSVQAFSEGLAIVQIGFNETARSGFIDTYGNEVISLQYRGGVGAFSEGLAVACITTSRCYFIDKSGREIASLPLKTSNDDYFDDLKEDMMKFSIGSKWGFIDRTGRVVVPATYDWVNPFSGGLSIVCADRNGRRVCGFMDKSGKEVTSLKFTQFGSDKFGRYESSGFEGGFQPVGIGTNENGLWGFIDRTGKEIVSPRYKTIWSYALKKDGLIGVTFDGKRGFVDKYGNEYFDF